MQMQVSEWGHHMSGLGLRYQLAHPMDLPFVGAVLAQSMVAGHWKKDD